MGFRLIEHTADLGAEVTGQTLEQIFADAARALTSVVVEHGQITPQVERRLRLVGFDAPDLLVAWLSELLLLLDTEGLVFCSFEFSRLEETSLEAVVRGEPLDPGRHGLGREVKAVTYHELEVRRTDQGWRARLVFDL